MTMIYLLEFFNMLRNHLSM